MGGNDAGVNLTRTNKGVNIMRSANSIRLLVRMALLLAITLAVQVLRLPTPVTGPLVNMMLILSAAVVGTAGGVLIGLLTPWVALLLGILPPALAPAVPFIMAGNAFYCLFFGLLNRRFKGSDLVGVGAGSLIKFGLIAAPATYLLRLPPPLVQVLLAPQLINALIGGVAALLLIRPLRQALSNRKS